jgi:hypothetical protein
VDWRLFSRRRAVAVFANNRQRDRHCVTNQGLRASNGLSSIAARTFTMDYSRYTANLCALVLLAATGDALDATNETSLDWVLQKNLHSVMGMSNVGRIRNTDKTLCIAENGYTLMARYRAADDGTMRIDVFHDGERVFSEGIDGQGVWEWSGDQAAPENVTHDGVAALEHGIEFNLFQLAELPGRGHAVELLGEDEIRGKRYYVLKLTLHDGFETYRYVNAESWLVEISRDHRAIHPGIDATRKDMETRFDQFERSDGILSARRSQQFELTSDEPVQTTVLLSSKYNVPPAELDIDRTWLSVEPLR